MNIAKLHPLFTSHAVFSAHKPILVFGYGEYTDVKSITFENDTANAVPFGGSFPNAPTWIAELPARDYGEGYTLTVEFSDSTEILNDISVGEVFLAAGQSNMQFKLAESSYPKEKWRENNRLRVFTNDRPQSGEAFSPADGWLVFTKENVGNISAIGYHLAEDISERLNCDVGIVTCYQGASIIESWIPEKIADEIILPESELMIDHTIDTYSKWNKCGMLYDYTFTKICPYSFSAVAWYQGESDTSVGEAVIYDKELKILIDSWRKDLCNDALDFFIIQIADFSYRTDDGWRLLQKAQERACENIKNCYLVRSADVCENNDIHPKTKEKLAKRIADAFIRECR